MYSLEKIQPTILERHDFIVAGLIDDRSIDGSEKVSSSVEATRGYPLQRVRLYSHLAGSQVDREEYQFKRVGSDTAARAADNIRLISFIVAFYSLIQLVFSDSNQFALCEPPSPYRARCIGPFINWKPQRHRAHASL